MRCLVRCLYTFALYKSLTRPFHLSYLEDFAPVGAPCVAEAPCSVTMAVEDADLAVYGASRAAVAISVEGYGLDEILVAVLEIQIKGRLVVAGRGRNRGRHLQCPTWC